MAEIAICAAEKLVEYAIDPIVNQFKYLFCYVKNIQNLRDEVETLERQQNGVQQLIDAAKRNANILDENVLAWLGNVDDIKKEADDVLNITANSATQCICFNPNLKFRYWQGRKATEITTAVVELQKKGVFQVVGYPTPPQQMSINVPRDAEGLETRISTRKEIVEALKDEQTYIIGICGMPGVGKTTMAQEIAKEGKKLFDEVVIAVVSRDPDIKKIQDQIVEALDKKIQENNNEGVRAGRVKERLTFDVHNKTLIILDDVWEEVDLQKIGIPQQSEFKGLKILLTTRFKAVCDIMGANKIYAVELLPESEALKLLKDTAKILDDTSEVVKGLAAQVAKECGGLPLSLVIIGKALINKEEYAWRDVLQQLKNSRVTNIKGVHEQVYEIIGYSYNNLKSEDVKSLFLLCSLFPEDYNISIETLVRFSKGLDMFRDTATLYDTRNRVSSIVFDLKSSYLLLSGEMEDEVKLHDVVRDFCLLIASQGKHVYMSKHSGLKEWREHVDDNSHTAISLTFDDEPNELPSGLEYPNLKLLRLVSREIKMSNDFFSKMNQLRVFELNCPLLQIPSSLQSLTNLQTLCFDRCVLNTNISTIGSLKKLEILSFFESHLSDFPIEIEQLSNLKSLDLRFSKGPHPLPRGVLLRLNKLEELYLGAHFATWWDERGNYEVEKEYIVEELSTLQGLKTFQICTCDPEFLLEMLKRMSLEKLQRFQIICTNKRRRIGDYHFERSLDLNSIKASMIKESIIHDSLLWRTGHLQLRVNDSLKNFVNELDEYGFVNLKTLSLWFCSIKYLINATEFTPRSAFPNLEQLYLDGVDDLKGICKGNLPPGAFARLQKVCLNQLPHMQHLWRGILKPPSLCNLRNFEMARCSEISSLFSESAAKCLLNLERLEISDSRMLEHIVSRDAAEDEVTDEVLELKKLRYLELDAMDRLKSFRSQSNADTKILINQVTFPSLEELRVGGLKTVAKIVNDEVGPNPLDKLRVLTVKDCDGLVTIAQSDAIRVVQNLESLEVGHCKTLRVLFAFEGLKVTKEETWSILDRLRSLELYSLPKLEHIVTMVPQGICVFQNLTSLEVHYCDSLRYLLSPSMASSLSALETLSLRSCETMEKVVAWEEEVEMVEPEFTDKERGESYKLVFPKLSTLKLIELQSMKMFCSENIGLVFPSLHKLVIAACPVMLKFSSQEPIAPKLKKMQIGPDRFVDFSNVLDPGLMNEEIDTWDL